MRASPWRLAVLPLAQQLLDVGDAPRTIAPYGDNKNLALSSRREVLDMAAQAQDARDEIDDLLAAHARHLPNRSGSVANYIPELAIVDPDRFEE